jgi:ribosomal protein S18 acetylase RimI-like enzyme
MFSTIIYRGYLLRSFTIDDVESTSQLMSETFTAREPITLAMEIGYEEHLSFSRALTTEAARDGLSLVAEERETGKIVGYLISEDLFKVQSESLPPKYIPIFDLLDELSRDYKSTAREHSRKVLHLLMVGVDLQHAQQGLATKLVSHTINSAPAAGFGSAVTEATATYSQNLFNTLGFATTKEILYREHKLNGIKPFARIQTPTKCLFMEKELQHQVSTHP